MEIQNPGMFPFEVDQYKGRNNNEKIYLTVLARWQMACWAFKRKKRCVLPGRYIKWIRKQHTRRWAWWKIQILKTCQRDSRPRKWPLKRTEFVRRISGLGCELLRHLLSLNKKLKNYTPFFNQRSWLKYCPFVVLSVFIGVNPCPKIFCF